MLGSIISSCRWRQLTNTMHLQRMHEEPEPQPCILVQFHFLTSRHHHWPYNISILYHISPHQITCYKRSSRTPFMTCMLTRGIGKNDYILGVVKPVPLESFNDQSNAWSLRNWTFSYVFGPTSIITAQRHCPVVGLSDATDNNYEIQAPSPLYCLKRPWQSFYKWTDDDACVENKAPIQLSFLI